MRHMATRPGDSDKHHRWEARKMGFIGMHIAAVAGLAAAAAAIVLYIATADEIKNVETKVD